MNTPLKDLEASIERLSKLPMRTDAEIAEWRFQNEVIPWLRNNGFKDRFFARVLLSAKQQAVYHAMKAKLKGVGAIVALVGERGLGKTTLVSLLAQERAMDESLNPHQRMVLYRKMTALIDRYKALYADFGSIDSDSARSSRTAICGWADLLVIDEIHEADDQRMKARILTDLVDQRYAGRKDTVLISNQTPAEFQNTTSDSILSRLSQHGSIIECKWQSFRVKQV